MRPKQSASYKYRVSSQIVLKILTKHCEIFTHFAHYCTKICTNTIKILWKVVCVISQVTKFDKEYITMKRYLKLNEAWRQLRNFWYSSQQLWQRPLAQTQVKTYPLCSPSRINPRSWPKMYFTTWEYLSQYYVRNL